MIWQDLVITLANVLFIVSLINQAYYGFKSKKGLIALTTSIPTVIGLYAMSFAFFTLTLYFSSGTMFISATIWVILLIQRIIYGKV